MLKKYFMLKNVYCQAFYLFSIFQHLLKIDFTMKTANGNIEYNP